MSAAMALAHEMGHAAIHLDLGTYAFSRLPAENHEIGNLNRHETPIAQELGEYTRRNYNDVSGLRKMDNSTDWGRLYNPSPWWQFWNWRNRSAFENQNTWTP